MTVVDLRLPEFNVAASAGTSQEWTFTATDGANPVAITSLSVFVGGTLTDVDDLTSATEHAATISGASNEVATVTVAITTGTPTPLRIELDGEVVTSGKLVPKTSGAVSAPSGDFTVTTAAAASFTLSVVGAGALSVHAADTTTHGTTGDIVGTSDTQTLTNKTVDDFTNDVHADTVHAEVRNVSGVTLAKGVPVYITGYNVGQEIVTVDLADATDASTMPAIGLTDTAIDNNSNGSIELIGRISDLDTSAFSVGDELYVSETAGELTATAPTTLVQKVGTVVRSHASLGVIEVALDPSADAPSGTSGVWIPAAEMKIAGGSPSLGSQNNHPVWLYDQTAIEDTVSNIVIPSSWSTVNVSIYWTNAGAGAGDVVWRLATNVMSDGSTLANIPGTERTITAPAQNVVKVSSLETGLAVTAGQPHLIHIRRRADRVADTLANDSALLGVILTRAS